MNAFLILSILASATAPAGTGDVQKDLSVRLEPGDVWRQSVQCEAEVEFADGTAQTWEFGCTLRLEVEEAFDDHYTVDGRFIDWRLTWDGGPFELEWHDSHLRTRGTVPGADLGTEACRQVWRAWSEGLREADLRFRLGRDGRVAELEGLAALWSSVEDGLEHCPDLPPAFAELYGPAGLERVRAVMLFALSTPRPLEPSRTGRTWTDQAWLPDFPASGWVRRDFRLAGFVKDRRYRLARVDLRPALGDANGIEPLGPATNIRSTPSNRVEIRLDNGLVHELTADLGELARPVALPERAAEREATYRIRAFLED